MTLDTFFEKFELLADAPDAVGRMRELVLRLAVRGALTSQQEGDDAVGELTKELDRSREQRVGKSRDGRALGSEETSKNRPFVVPEHWEWIRLNRIGSLSGGLTPSKSNPAYWDGDLNWFTSRDIKSDELTDSGLKITELAADENGLQRYRPGCLFIVARSGILRRTFPVAINRVQATSNQDLKVLEPYVEGLEKYLQIMLRGMTNFILSSLVKTGTTVESLKYLEFENQLFPLPPLAEQKRIVAKVEELMALCDRLEAQQQERATRHAALARASLARFAEAPTPAHLDLLFHPSYDIPPAELRKAILTLAVQGKLVAQDPGDESVVESIGAARRSAGLAAKSLPQRTREEVPFDAPESWRWVTVGDVAESRLGKMLDNQKNRGEAHPYLRNTNVHWFRFELRSIKTMLFETSELAEYRVEPGDVLICEGGHGIARSAVWDGELPGVMFQKALHRVRPLSCLNAHFLTFCLWLYEQDGILQSYYTGAGIPHFTGKALARVAFPLPPLAEQRRIVAKVEQLMVLVDRLEARLTASRESAGKLLDAVVAELSASPHFA